MVNGTFMLIAVVIIAICVMLVLVILSQNPKGGGLSSTFGGGGGGQMFGVQRTNNFLDRATWTLSAIIAVLIIASNFVLPRQTQNDLVPELELPDVEAPAPVQETAPAPLETPTGIPDAPEN